MNSRDISNCGITLVSDIARMLDKSTLRRHLVFVLGACLAVLLSGYHFGTFDQIVHISFLKKIADPCLYPNDPLMDLRQFHTSYFWFLFLPFYYGPVTSWEDAQRWAQQNTSVEARFITPPHIYGMYTSDWRVFSERSPVVTIPELMEVIFAPQYLPDWLERLDALAPGASARFKGNSADTVRFVREAFYANSPQQFRNLAKDYQAQYLVVEKPHIQPFKVVYENEGYVIYDMR